MSRGSECFALFKRNEKKSVRQMRKCAAILLAAAIFSCFNVPVVSAGSSCIPINRKNFPDEALREAVAAFDSDGDGRLQKKEIKAAESLHITKFLDPDDVDREADPDAAVPHNQKSDFIFRFQGMEYFTNLKELVINLSGGTVKKTGRHYASVITDLDQVYALRKLEKFELISAKVKKIDLSKLPKLQKTKLYLSGVHSILINNRELKKFYFSDESESSKWKSVDFSNAPKLKYVSLYGLQGADLMFGKQNRRMKALYVSGRGKTKTTSMDLTKLASLEKFEATNLKIKTLDFSKNKKLASVFLERCSMKTLDFSQNVELIDVCCEGKKTKEIILPKKNKIKYFRWSNAGLSEFCIKQLNPKTLTILHLAGNSIPALNLKKYEHLEWVYVDKNTEVMLPASLSEDIVSRW